MMENYIKPIFITVEDYKTSCESTKVSTTSNFRNEYAKHMEAMSIVADCAKVYILENYEKVKDWSDLNLYIKSGTSQTTGETHFYKYKKHRVIGDGSSIVNKIFTKEDKRLKKEHNPIQTLTNVVLDPTDGDFSLTINGLAFWWIYEDAIIKIADYIEKQIKEPSLSE